MYISYIYYTEQVQIADVGERRHVTGLGLHHVVLDELVVLAALT